MRPYGWTRLASGEWRPSLAWRKGEGEWGPWDEDPTLTVQGLPTTAVPVSLPELEVVASDGMLHPAEEVGLPVAIPISTVDGDVTLWIYAGEGVAPGATVRVTGDNGCEYGHWHVTTLPISAGHEYALLLDRGLYGPDPPTVSASSPDVWMQAKTLA